MADNETPLGWLTYPNSGDRSWYSTDAEGQGIADWLARVELLGVPTYATYSDLPDPSTTPTAANTGGFTQRQFAAVVGDATIYRSDGTNWIPWLGSGTLNRRLPDTRYFDSADANDMSVQNAPTAASDVARQAELDDQADDPHDNAAHSETYATTTQLNNKADDPHDNAAHSEDYVTVAEDVEDFSTSGATNAVPVSQGDGTLQMQTTVENSDKLDGLDASDFNTGSTTGQADEVADDFVDAPSIAYDNVVFIGTVVDAITFQNEGSTSSDVQVAYGDSTSDIATVSTTSATTFNPAKRVNTIYLGADVRIFNMDYRTLPLHDHTTN